MGIVENTLAECSLSDEKDFRIEDNVNGKIHIHINDMRIEVSEQEFEQLRHTILNGYNELIELKDGI